jgi:hypothetical protein
LQENLEAIHKQGYGVATISYDSAAVIRAVVARKHFTFPMLADPESKIIRAWGVFNGSVQRDSFVYGAAYPGTFVIGPDLRVVAKYFEFQYNDRMPVMEVLRQMGGAPAGPQVIRETRHLKLAASASSTWVHPNERVTLSVDIVLPPKMHLYAPGVKGYHAIEWKMEDTPGAKFEPVRYPASRQLHLPVIDETVPAYVDSFRLTEDIITGYESRIRPLLDAKGEWILHGTLRYQACDDRMCYLPETVPLEWSFTFRPLDRTRSAPAALQRPGH